jgi:hypothetical protein
LLNESLHIHAFLALHLFLDLAAEQRGSVGACLQPCYGCSFMKLAIASRIVCLCGKGRRSEKGSEQCYGHAGLLVLQEEETYRQPAQNS